MDNDNIYFHKKIKNIKKLTEEKVGRHTRLFLPQCVHCEISVRFPFGNAVQVWKPGRGDQQRR